MHYLYCIIYACLSTLHHLPIFSGPIFTDPIVKVIITDPMGAFGTGLQLQKRQQKVNSRALLLLAPSLFAFPPVPNQPLARLCPQPYSTLLVPFKSKFTETD